MNSFAPSANPWRTLRFKIFYRQSPQRKPAKSAEQEAAELLKLHHCLSLPDTLLFAVGTR